MKNQTLNLLSRAILGLCLLFALVPFSACQRIEPNYVGVLMENYGKSGKSDFSIVKGTVNTMGPGTQLYEVPLFEQRAAVDSALHLKAADNTEFFANPKYSYKIIEQRAVDVVFENKHLDKGSNFMRSLEDNVLETRMYDIIKEESRKYLTDTLMSNGGSLKFEQVVQEIVKKEFELRGLALITLTVQLEFSVKVKEKIEQRNEVNTNISVLDQQIMEQRKRNELAELKAQENLIFARSLTPELLQYKFIEKWDGKTSLYGASSPVHLLKNVP